MTEKKYLNNISILLTKKDIDNIRMTSTRIPFPLITVKIKI